MTGSEDKNTEPAPATVTSTVQDRWGIEIVGIRLSAAGYMLDFRYRVIEPEKAASILDPKVKPYLIDQKSGVKCAVPNVGKVGTLRQTSRSAGKPQGGRAYLVVFANPGRSVTAGNKVTVVIGDFWAEDLIVR